MRLGLFLYDHLGARELLPPTRTLRLAQDPAGAPLKPEYSVGFEYSDCWVEDSRLVVLNARDAADRGATIAPRTSCVTARREDGVWRLTLRDELTAQTYEISARALVNAAGPWVGDVIGAIVGVNAHASVRLVKGSHIVTERLFSHDRCYIFQNNDGRVLFAIPYERDFTLIGTTDLDYSGDPGAVAASDAGDRISLQGGERLLPRARHHEPGDLELFRRPSAVRRRRLRRASRDARLCAQN